MSRTQNTQARELIQQFFQTYGRVRSDKRANGARRIKLFILGNEAPDMELVRILQVQLLALYGDKFRKLEFDQYNGGAITINLYVYD